MPSTPAGPTRREILSGAAGALALARIGGAAGAAGDAAPAAALEGAPPDGPIAHLLPTASHDRLLLKASFTEPVAAPVLRIGRRTFAGRATATSGRFFVFDAAGLEPAQRYELRIADRAGRTIGAPWQLATFPARESAPEHLRLLVFTCAGGHDVMVRPDGERGFLPIATRRRLLARALSFEPQVVIANGDHVYWDQHNNSGGPGPGRSEAALAFAGEFDTSLPVLGSPNERVLERAVGPQVAELYRDTLRSTPVFFLQDDHDYFDGDRASDLLVTFPPDPFRLRAARTAQWLYYPEFLPDAARPAGLASESMDDRPPGVSECFGTLRYGRLLELLLYDCRRHQTLNGKVGTLVPDEVEAWLHARMAATDTRHLVQVPSIPVGYTAGKWGEWYPDVLGEDRRLTTKIGKDFWQEGWLRQHDRLLLAASAMRRIPLFLDGDLHSIAEATIESSGEHDFSKNPIRTALVGPLGTGSGWPSGGRGTVGTTSAVLGAEQGLPCLEENGFVIADVEPDAITLRFFRWRPVDGRAQAGGEETIDTLEPFRTTRMTV
jgi:hypothetical protein